MFYLCVPWLGPGQGGLWFMVSCERRQKGTMLPWPGESPCSPAQKEELFRSPGPRDCPNCRPAVPAGAGVRGGQGQLDTVVLAGRQRDGEVLTAPLLFSFYRECMSVCRHVWGCRGVLLQGCACSRVVGGRRWRAGAGGGCEELSQPLRFELLLSCLQRGTSVRVGTGSVGVHRTVP